MTEPHLEALRVHFAATDLRSLAAAGDLAGLQAVLQRHPEAVDVASDTGATALMQAARFGHSACVAALLAAGADANAEMDAYYTALQLAASGGHAACVRALDAGASPDMVSKQCPYWQAAAHLAAAGGEFGCLRALLTAGAGWCVRGSSEHTHGWHLLHVAAGSKAEDALRCAQLLLVAGADAHCRGRNGQSALHGAMISSASLETVELLLAAGCDPHAAGERRESLNAANLRFWGCQPPLVTPLLWCFLPAGQIPREKHPCIAWHALSVLLAS